MADKTASRTDGGPDPLENPALLRQLGWLEVGDQCWADPMVAKALNAIGWVGFQRMMELSCDGERVLEISMRPTRPVVKFRLTASGPWYYLKRHLVPPQPTHWRQKLGGGPRPSDAWREWLRIRCFATAQLTRMRPVAIGWGAFQGCPQASFLLTEELPGEPLERYLFHHFTGPVTAEQELAKQALVAAAARLTRRMHAAGLTHQDWYLGHIWVSPQPDGTLELEAIDVQRARLNGTGGLRGRIKDLAQLHFSADPKYISDDARRQFLQTYWQCQKFSPWQRLLITWIGLKAARIRRHTEKALGIPYARFFDNKYW